MERVRGGETERLRDGEAERLGKERMGEWAMRFGSLEYWNDGKRCRAPIIFIATCERVKGATE